MRISKVWDRKKNGISKKDADYMPEAVYWWTCRRGHSFRSSVCADNSKRKIRKCGLCETPNELRVYRHLISLYGIEDIVYQPTMACCKTPRGCYQKFDFLVESAKVLIEVDGEQHFTDEYEGGCSMRDDTEKAVNAVRDGYRMVRIANCQVKQPDLCSKLKFADNQPTIVYYPPSKYGNHINLFKELSEGDKLKIALASIS